MAFLAASLPAVCENPRLYVQDTQASALTISALHSLHDGLSLCWKNLTRKGV